MENTWKGLASVLIAAVMSYAMKLAAPVIVLVVVMLMDYVTGIIAAAIEEKLDSRVGLVGILKKVCYMMVVAVGMAVDYIIAQTGATLGVQADLAGYFGMLTCVWLILNELISILENAGRIGLPIPEFLQKALAKLRKKSEEE